MGTAEDVWTWIVAYCIFTSALAHAWTIYRWRERRKHYRRSKRAKKAAATRKRNGTQPRPRQPKVPVGELGAGRHPFTGPTPKPKPVEEPDERVVTAESAWFHLLNDDEDDPEYNEIDPKTWQPVVRRFDGGAKEYAARDETDGSVGS